MSLKTKADQFSGRTAGDLRTGLASGQMRPAPQVRARTCSAGRVNIATTPQWARGAPCPEPPLCPEAPVWYKRSDYSLSSELPSVLSVSSAAGVASSAASSEGAHPPTLTASAMIKDAISALITFPFPFFRRDYRVPKRTLEVKAHETAPTFVFPGASLVSGFRYVPRNLPLLCWAVLRPLLGGPGTHSSQTARTISSKASSASWMISSSVLSWIGCGTKMLAGSNPRASDCAFAASMNSLLAMYAPGTPRPSKSAMSCKLHDVQLPQSASASITTSHCVLISCFKSTGATRVKVGFA